MRRCLIADDHALVRDALVATVAMRWPRCVALQASDFPAAWALATPGTDLCLADLDMPGAGPLEGVDGLRAAAPDMPILVVTGSYDDAMMLALLERGVAGFAHKNSSSAVILAALELVLAGGRYLPPRLAELHLPRASPPPPPSAARALSARQLDVLRLMAQGLTNKDIARELGLAPATIKTHVEQVIAATGAANRTDAAVRARDRGLI